MAPHLTVGGGDPALDERLSAELDAHDVAAVGHDHLLARGRGCPQRTGDR